jgi:hypothetical protein
LSGNNLRRRLHPSFRRRVHPTPVWDSSLGTESGIHSRAGTPGIPDSRGSQDPSLGFIPCLLGSQIPVDPRLPSGI